MSAENDAQRSSGVGRLHDGAAPNRRGSISFLSRDLSPDDIVKAGGGTVTQHGREFRLVIETLIVDPFTGEITCEIEEAEDAD